MDVSSGSLPSGAWSSESLPLLWNLDPENKLSMGEKLNFRYWRGGAVADKRSGARILTVQKEVDEAWSQHGHGQSASTAYFACVLQGFVVQKVAATME